jgi:hypothetical protein
LRPFSIASSCYGQHLDLGDGQVLGDAHVREQFEILENHADLGAQLGEVGFRIADRDAINNDFAGLERLQPIDALDQRRLARTGGAADDDDFALLTEVVQSVSTWKLP